MKPRLSPFAQRGLTMLELCIAIAILAVLGAIALPTLGARLDQQRLYTPRPKHCWPTSTKRASKPHARAAPCMW